MTPTKAFDAVIQQYVRALWKQKKRMERQRRDFFTKHEQAAQVFYGDAWNKLIFLSGAND